jgi:hypothetical protein
MGTAQNAAESCSGLTAARAWVATGAVTGSAVGRWGGVRVPKLAKATFT